MKTICALALAAFFAYPIVPLAHAHAVGKRYACEIINENPRIWACLPGWYEKWRWDQPDVFVPEGFSDTMSPVEITAPNPTPSIP